MVKNILKYPVVQIAVVAITAAAVLLAMLTAYISEPIINRNISGYLALAVITLTTLFTEYCTAKAIIAYTAK